MPPRLTAQRDPSGPLRLRLAGGSGVNHVLQASTNLTDWITALTTNSPAGVVEFVDPESVQVPAAVLSGVHGVAPQPTQELHSGKFARANHRFDV